MAGAEESRIAVKQFRRKQAFPDTSGRAVEIRQKPIEQCCPLLKRARNLLPFGFGNQQRDQVQIPRAIQAVGIPVNVMSDAVFTDQPAGEFAAAQEFFRAQIIHLADEHAPVRAERTVRFDHFIGAAAPDPVTGRKTAGLRKAHKISLQKLQRQSSSFEENQCADIILSTSINRLISQPQVQCEGQLPA